MRRGIPFVILGLAALAVALVDTKFRFLAVFVGLVCFFIAGTLLSKATQIAQSLRPLVKRTVRVEVWGRPLPDSSQPLFQIDSIRALGAGLLIHLRATSGGPRSLLKVAQPTSMTLNQDHIEISDAAYVSWAGTKLKPAVGTKMPALVLLTLPNSQVARTVSAAS
jgi:hypothetical protein